MDFLFDIVNYQKWGHVVLSDLTRKESYRGEEIYADRCKDRSTEGDNKTADDRKTNRDRGEDRTIRSRKCVAKQHIKL